MPDCIVQPWTPEVGPAAIALVLDIQQRELGVPITLADQPDLADVARAYFVNAGGFWVAREGDDVVGTIALLDDGGGAPALRKMFVRADRRGRAFGVAQRLFDALLAHARARSLPQLTLGTRPEMHAAHRFYERNGFVRIGEADLPATFPRMKLDSVFYRLDLAR